MRSLSRYLLPVLLLVPALSPSAMLLVRRPASHAAALKPRNAMTFGQKFHQWIVGIERSVLWSD